MQLIYSNTTNRLLFTLTGLMESGDSCYLYMKHISTLDTYFIEFAKSSNLSPAPERYDMFDISIPSVPKGQFLYSIYEGDSGATSPEDIEVTNLLECGMLLCQLQETTIPAFQNSINYIEPNL